MYEWLKDLKPGDKVLICRSGPGPADVAIVERLTPKQIVLEGHETRFIRYSGFQICPQRDREYRCVLHPWTAEAEANYNANFAEHLAQEEWRGKC